ncbi:hypothetical protein [Streptomyces sp. NPDC050392]|uniref:DUF6414 family protein n=1 Tax=Streptomyces sp. NPDC050392 TaxID=3155782 RepID=UPI0034186F45
MFRRFGAWVWSKISRRGTPELKRLREFIYLDEVSVTSLLSSIRGAIPSEITQKLTRSARTENSGGGEYKTSLFKVTAGTKREITHTTDYQVLRKASIQATFKDLYANVESSLVLRSTPMTEMTTAEKKRIREGTETTPWLIKGSNLKRGQLLELEVELRADPIFRTSTIIASMANIIGQSPSLSSEVNTQEMRTAIEVNSFIQELMAGLIPIKCRVLHYGVHDIEGQEFLVHSDALPTLPGIYRRSRKPIYLVGVVEQGHFWKDIRRVLFSSSAMKVLCRVGRDHLQESWSPVKLVDVLKEVIPDMESAMDEFGPSALRSMTGGASGGTDVTQLRESALIRYAELLVDLQGSIMTDILRSRITQIASTRSSGLGSVIANRAAFTEVADCVAAELSYRFAAEDLARLRAQSFGELGLLVDGSITVRPENPSGRLDGDLEGKFIDAEIVAIYW